MGLLVTIPSKIINMRRPIMVCDFLYLGEIMTEKLEILAFGYCLELSELNFKKAAGFKDEIVQILKEYDCPDELSHYQILIEEMLMEETGLPVYKSIVLDAKLANHFQQITIKNIPDNFNQRLREKIKNLFNEGK